MAVSYQVIGRNLKKVRSKLLFTQEQVASLAGMSALHYGRLERGERRASLDQLDLFANLLNTSLESLLHGSSDSLTGVSYSEENSLGQVLESIAAGCSHESHQLMIDVCRLIAKRDKQSTIELYPPV